MNIRDMAIEFIRKNPGCTSAQIASGAGIPRRLIQPLMTELQTQEVVIRYARQGHPFFYRLPLESDRALLGAQYEAHRAKAIELETRGCWRRAAREWLLAMDSTRNDEARAKATDRREYCIRLGCVGISSEVSSINSVSVPAIDLWRD